nr:molecular chaperone HscB [Halisarca dujardinii]
MFSRVIKVQCCGRHGKKQSSRRCFIATVTQLILLYLAAAIGLWPLIVVAATYSATLLTPLALILSGYSPCSKELRRRMRTLKLSALRVHPVYGGGESSEEEKNQCDAGPEGETGKKARNVRITSPRAISPDICCWSCDRVLENVRGQSSSQFFCDCEKSVVLPPSGKDHFSILGCSRSFHIDAGSLKKSFLLLQALLHPDKTYTNTSKVEQEYSADQSAVVNGAYATLKRPYTRAKYILTLEGVELRSSHGGELDNSFLMEVMEENEMIEGTDDPALLEEIEKANFRILAGLESEISSYFSSKNFDKARDVLAKMKYYQTILDNVSAKLNKE